MSRPIPILFFQPSLISSLLTEDALGTFFEISIKIPQIELKLGEVVYSLEGSADHILAAFLTFLWIEMPTLQAQFVGLFRKSVVLLYKGSATDLRQILMKYFMVGDDSIAILEIPTQSDGNIPTYFSFAELV